MPPPMSRYHEPPPVLAGSISAARHRRCSRASVPLLSPRDTKGAPASPIAMNAATASWPPAMCAGSARGPTTMKSFQAICRRSAPWPSAMNCCSASGSCTSTRSASPRAAVASAWPVPCARTRTEIPVVLVNSGRTRARSPEFSTEVVEASTIVSLEPARPATKVTQAARTIAANPNRTSTAPRRRRARRWLR
jgi:hypothetical protein